MITLPSDRLPETEVERHAILRDYFCDKDASAVLTPKGWELNLYWSNDHVRYVDPHLSVGLDWWGGGIQCSDMVAARRRSGRILSTLYDTWTLYSWSQWLATKTVLDVESVVILHVDDHRDISTPRLFIEEEGLLDPFSNSFVDITTPDSVHSAILSGAIGMGSFLTPFLHALPFAEVRHLCKSPKVQRTQDYKISLIEECDTFLADSAHRPAIRLEAQPSVLGPGCYRITSDVNAWLKDIGHSPLLLHIDMDYFNNRYNGDSDWQMEKCNFDPSLNIILTKIDELIESLRDAGYGPHIEDIVVAFSPGFFPAEYWSIASDHLLPALEQLHVC